MKTMSFLRILPALVFLPTLFPSEAAANVIAYDPFDTVTSSAAADPENGIYWANVDQAAGSVAGDGNRDTRNGGIIGFGVHPWESTHTTFRAQSSRLDTPQRTTEQNGAVRVLNFKGSTGGPSIAYRRVWRDLDAPPEPTATLYQSGIVEAFTADSGHSPGGMVLFGFGNEWITDESVMDEASTERFEGLLWGFRANETGDRLDLIVRATVDAATHQIEDFVLLENLVQRQRYFIVVRVDINADGKDVVTAWVNPGATAGGADPDGGLTFETEAFSSASSVTRFAMLQQGVLHTGGNSSINRVGFFDAPTLGTTYSSVADTPDVFYQLYGSDSGRGAGAGLDRTVPEDWSLEPTALRLTASNPDYHASFASAELTSIEPGSDFGTRGHLTVADLDAASSDTAVGHLVLGPSEPVGSAGFETYYFAHWVPNGSGGSFLRIREGATGTILAEEPWTGTAAAPGNGYTLTTLGAYGIGGDLTLAFRLTDASGHTGEVTASIPFPASGSRFGFGAWHRAGETPAWDFHDFGVTERRFLDYRLWDAPFSLEFGTQSGQDGIDGLLAAHPRPEAWSLEFGGLRFARDTGPWESSITAAPVANYHPGQDFTIEVDLSPQRLDDVGLNRFGIAVLGKEHEPFLEPFNPEDDSGYYSLTWIPAVDIETSELRIRQGFNGTELASVVWTGLHPNMLDAFEGIGTTYRLRAEGVFQEDGSLELSFTMTDQNNHSQTVTAPIANPAHGNIFGFGGRTQGPQMPEAIFSAFSVELGEEPVPAGTTFADWQTGVFSEPELADESISGKTASPAGDGVPNLLKYAANLTPGTPATSADFGTLEEDNGEWTFTYLERRDASDLVYLIEVSEDLAGWSGAGVEETGREDAGDGMDRVTVEVSGPYGARLFVRLRVEDL